MPAKKKSTKNSKNQQKSIENQISNMEKSLNAIDKIKNEKIEKEIRQEKIQDKVDIIKEDLTNQLLSKNKFGKHFSDMIEDYLFFVKLKEDLQYDIKINGLRYDCKTGNGYTTDKPNESVQNLLKVNGQMLKILQELDLKEPDTDPSGEGEGDDLL